MSDMGTLILTCPNCRTENEVPRKSIVIKCGIVSCRCICSNCSQDFEDQQEYWQWLGLTEGPPAELNPDPFYGNR